MNGRPWTDREDKRVAAMRKDGFSDIEIEEALDRPRGSVCDRVRIQRMSPEKREARRVASMEGARRWRLRKREQRA